MTARTAALRITVVATAVAALVGILGILANGLSNTGVDALGTAMTVTIASLFCLPCFTVWDGEHTRLVARAGVTATVGGSVLMLYIVWGDPRGDRELGKLFGMLAIVAVGCVHACILSRTKLAPTRRWLRTTALASSCACGALMIAAICMEAEDKNLYALIGILFVITGAMTVVVALDSFSARETRSSGVAGDVCFCPGCGRSMWEPSGQILCHGCGDTFVVTKVVVADLPVATLS